MSSVRMIEMPSCGKSLVLPTFHVANGYGEIQYDAMRVALNYTFPMQVFAMKGANVDAFNELLKRTWAKGHSLSDKMLMLAHVIKMVEDGKVAIEEIE